MRSASIRLVCFWLVALTVHPLGAQPAEEAPSPPASSTAGDDEAVHQELMQLRESVISAVNSQNVEGLLAHLHPNVVVIWQNAEISRGHEGVRKYYQEKLGGPDAVLTSYTVEPTVSERTAIYGDDTGLAFGTVLCHFEFKNGSKFDLNGPWSATLIRNEGTWQIASFHGSSGLFDNPLLVRLQGWMVWACVIAAAVGMAVGAALVSWVKRRRSV